MHAPRILIALALAAFVAAPAVAADAAAGETKFKQLCAACHGATGEGDGAAAASLKPKPRNLADAQWQATVDDEYLRKVITKGGAAVGKSPLMTPWGHALKGADLDNVVAYIRSLK